MRLTWKDAIATLVAGANTLVYVLYLQGTDLPIIDSVRGAAAAILGMGVFGGCALGSTAEVFLTDRTVAQRSYITIANLLGAAALISGVTALIGDNPSALAVLYYATIALWFIATLRHYLARPVAPQPRVKGR